MYDDKSESLRVASEGLAQAHVFSQATQQPFQIDWHYDKRLWPSQSRRDKHFLTSYCLIRDHLDQAFWENSGGSGVLKIQGGYTRHMADVPPKVADAENLMEIVMSAAREFAILIYAPVVKTTTSFDAFSQRGAALFEHKLRCNSHGLKVRSKTPIDHSLNGSRTKVASNSHSTNKRIENGAKTGIYGFVAIKSAYYSKPRQSRENSLSMPLERARENESNDALGSYWNSPWPIL
ncbi:hypothetical protein Tco_1127503 [Tanacetum coccineum]